ncbi:hypothetical protein [Streptomyces sp. NPDC001741]|uniref:hypothetical protein n=1 Tax=Streptomyces sp. NPDC001741 TaxID=3364605 RepID=UPI0036C8B13A
MLRRRLRAWQDRRARHDRSIAVQLNKFYDSLTPQERSSAEDVALKYGRALHPEYQLLLHRPAAASLHHVGLFAEPGSFTHVTRRTVFVVDTLLLSDHGIGAMHQLGTCSRDVSFSSLPGEMPYEATLTHRYGMVTKDLTELGRWLLDAEPLLRAGLAWYGPVFARGKSGENREPPGPLSSFEDLTVDHVMWHGRAVDLVEVKPLAGRVVRPIVETDLPFLDGLSPGALARALGEESDVRARYRDLVRSDLLELDGALEAVHSQAALERIARSVRGHLGAAAAEMAGATRSGALARAGGVPNSVRAVLVAVRPDALRSALTVGARRAAGGAGLWPAVHAFAETEHRAPRGGWHYVWVLRK